MKAVVATFNQEKALVGAFSVIVQPVVEPMDRFAALIPSKDSPSSLLPPPLVSPAVTMWARVGRMSSRLVTSDTVLPGATTPGH